MNKDKLIKKVSDLISELYDLNDSMTDELKLLNYQQWISNKRQAENKRNELNNLINSNL